MKFMLDTNIVIDILSGRDGYQESLQIIKYCELGKITCFVSAVTVTDVMYILRKHIAPNLVRETVKTLLLIIDVACVLKGDIKSAFVSEVKDYEDAVQSACAKRINADYIVTRNLNDFKMSSITAVSPREALEIIAK
ncbi:MAG: PIN domain-containing protein [Defluviitaleaceae bacterium]|nr:PIN domain-containing protein [Defluviitaleaceae bacterium]MCL2239704.1 PIN domain-containing protein [Defluviitaleaceae bacterium]